MLESCEVGFGIVEAVLEDSRKKSGTVSQKELGYETWVSRTIGITFIFSAFLLLNSLVNAVEMVVLPDPGAPAIATMMRLFEEGGYASSRASRRPHSICSGFSMAIDVMCVRNMSKIGSRKDFTTKRRSQAYFQDEEAERRTVEE